MVLRQALWRNLSIQHMTRNDFFPVRNTKRKFPKSIASQCSPFLKYNPIATEKHYVKMFLFPKSRWLYSIISLNLLDSIIRDR